MEDLRLPLPAGGVGGASVFLSDSERYVVLSLQSGQSEEGFELFEIGPQIRHIGGHEYIFAEGASFAFSPDETHLAMIYQLSCTGLNEHDIESSERDSEGALIVEFGGVLLYNIAAGTSQLCKAFVRAANSTSLEYSFYGDDFKPRFGNNEISFVTPWQKDALVPVILPSMIVVDGPEV